MFNWNLTETFIGTRLYLLTRSITLDAFIYELSPLIKVFLGLITWKLWNIFNWNLTHIRGLRQNLLTRPDWVTIDVFIYELLPLVKVFSKFNYFNNIKNTQFKLHINVHWHLSFPTIKTHNSCCIHGLCPLVNVFQSLMIDFKLIWQNCSPWWDSHLSMCIFPWKTTAIWGAPVSYGHTSSFKPFLLT